VKKVRLSSITELIVIADLKFIHNEEEEIDEKFIKKSQATSKKQKFAK
jgi:hypothetical protein